MDQNSTEENRQNSKLMGQLALFAEVCVMILRIIWSIFVEIYRFFIPLPKKPVKGEIVLITGAGHGLGRELALLYASEGATVVCLDINEESNNQTVASVNQMEYCQAYAYACDVSDHDKVQTTVDRIRNEVGEITILINNAAIMPTHHFLQHTKEEIEQTMKINVLGYHWTIKAVLPTMLKNNYGHIVAISSLCGRQGLVYLVPYCCSKFGIRGLMNSLRAELDFHKKFEIKTTTLYPYMMDTGLAKKPRARFPNLVPMVKPAEAAKCVMTAQRRDVLERTIPRDVVILDTMFTILPHAAENMLREFFGIYVDAE